MPAELSYQSGFGNEFATEAVAGALAGGPERAAEASARPLHRAVQRHAVHRAARHQSPHLDLSHPPLGHASPLRRDSRRADSQRPVQRSAHHAQSTALGSAAHPERADRFRRRHRHPRRQRRPGHADRRRHPSLRRQRLHARPLLLQRRRRVADRSATGRAALPHRARHPRGRSRRNLRDSARRQVPRRTAREARRAATSARTTACRSACPNSAPSAPTAWPIRATSNRPSPPTKIATASSTSSPNSWAASGPRSSITRRSTWCLARQLRALQVRPGALQLHQHRLLRPPRPVHLHGADRALGHSRHGQLRLRHLSSALDGRRAHLPPALVPPQPDERIHGPGLWRLRCQGRGICARRRQPAQLHGRPRPRCRDLRARQRTPS